jgi:hypothetical protein
VLDLALRPQLLKRAELILGRNPVIHTMELENVNSFKAQAVQTSFARSAQVFRPSIRHPSIRSGAIKACLCRDHQACRIWVQSFSNDFFAHRRPVRVGRINEINSDINSPPQDSNRFSTVFGLAPNSLSGDSHCAKPEPVNAQIPTDLELAGLGRRKASRFSFSGRAFHIFSFQLGTSQSPARLIGLGFPETCRCFATSFLAKGAGNIDVGDRTFLAPAKWMLRRRQWLVSDMAQTDEPDRNHHEAAR